MSKIQKKTFRLRTSTSIQDDAIVKYGVGMDVHKHKINVCISAKLQTDEIVTIQSHVFRNSPYGLDELVAFLRKFFPVSCYLMECTGVYHLPVFYKLREAFSDNPQKVIAMNPLLLHRRTGDLGLHADKADAIGLANFSHYTKLIRPSYIGHLSFYRVRELIRLYHRNNTTINRTGNRIIAILDGENFKFKLDIKKEWGLQLLDRVISQDWTFGEAFENLLKERKQAGKGTSVLTKRKVAIQEYLDFKFNSTSRFILQMHLNKLLYSQRESATFLRKAELLILDIQELKDAYYKLMLIPSIGSLAALTLLTELGDYYRFHSWKAFVKYCGVVPTTEDSGESHKRGHVNRHTNKFLRKVLTQCAGVLINLSGQDLDLSRYAHRQFRIRKLPYKLALMKVANKLARTVYNVLILSLVYDPNHEYVEKRKKQLARTLERKSSLLETYRTRALKRDVSDFLVSNFDFLNSTSKYHLTSGFKRLIRKSEWLDSQDDDN